MRRKYRSLGFCLGKNALEDRLHFDPLHTRVFCNFSIVFEHRLGDNIFRAYTRTANSTTIRIRPTFLLVPLNRLTLEWLQDQFFAKSSSCLIR